MITSVRWHQDIKPRNILVKSRSDALPYSYTFKLADYGRSHFVDPEATVSVAEDYDTFGTKTYGTLVQTICHQERLG